MVNAVIVDDERHCLKILSTLLARYCPEVKVCAQFQNPVEALAYLQKSPPDLLFLDIEMPRMSGFELIQHLGTPAFDIIFTTAFDQYAIKAFKVSASDYLLKPIDEDDLVGAVQRVQSRQDSSNEQIAFLLQLIREEMGDNVRKIAVPSSKGLDFVAIRSILYCTSDGNYTELYLDGKKKKVVSRTLKEIQELLPSDKFLRVHNSHLVNMDFVEQYVRTDGGYLVMADGAKIRVSRQKKALVIKQF
ncbi:MAG: LytTR family DNA-binding domain-containing protein [Saprospiraceae bacterium]|nr:LytTR family DNA-binding domain-containing protein [Saprospiraceae bacterium]